MAVQTPPYVLQNSSHGSELVRREALASLAFGTAGGVVPATAATSANATAGIAGCSDLKVNAPGSGMSVLINAGQAYVLGTLGSGSGYGIGTGYGLPTVTLNGGSAPTVASNAKATSTQLTTQGIYYCYNDNSAGQVSLVVAASNGSNPRIDVVIAQVEDAAYSGANNDWKLAVVTGTAAASPAVPALPANALVLAYLWIPTSSVNVTAGNILDLRIACNRNPFRWRADTCTTAPNGGPNQIMVYTNVVEDIVGNYSAVTGKYTTPVSGIYLCSASRIYTATTVTAANVQFGFRVGGAQVSGSQFFLFGSSLTGLYGPSGTAFLNAAQGSDIEFCNENGTGTSLAGATFNYFQGELLSPV